MSLVHYLKQNSSTSQHRVTKPSPASYLQLLHLKFLQLRPSLPKKKKGDVTVVAHTHSNIFLTCSFGAQIQPWCRPLSNTQLDQSEQRLNLEGSCRLVLIYINPYHVSQLFITHTYHLEAQLYIRK